jgi:hypothetical protein
MRASDFGTTLPGIAVPGYGPRFGESIENDGSYNFSRDRYGFLELK